MSFNGHNMDIGSLRDAMRLWKEEECPTFHHRVGAETFVNWLVEQINQYAQLDERKKPTPSLTPAAGERSICE